VRAVLLGGYDFFEARDVESDMPNTPETARDVTRLLQQGNPDYNAVMPLVYAQLLSMAQHSMRHGRKEHALSPATLVQEGRVRLSGGAEFFLSCDA
jgi:hypothetical protein